MLVRTKVKGFIDKNTISLLNRYFDVDFVYCYDYYTFDLDKKSCLGGGNGTSPFKKESLITFNELLNLITDQKVIHECW